MKANQFYVIHLGRTGNETPVLFLEDGTMKIVAQDSFGGNDGSARIVYQAPQDGDFRLIATTTNNVLAEMNLSVYALPK